MISQLKPIKLNKLLTKMERVESDKMVKDEVGKEAGANQEKRLISEADLNELLGESDDEEELLAFEA